MKTISVLALLLSGCVETRNAPTDVPDASEETFHALGQLRRDARYREVQYCQVFSFLGHNNYHRYVVVCYPNSGTNGVPSVAISH